MWPASANNLFKKAPTMAKHANHLHYDKEALLKEYRNTYVMFIKALMICVGGAVLAFFAFIVYLGGWSHTKAEPFVNAFGDRIDYEYVGTKLPIFGGPDKPETKEQH